MSEALIIRDDGNLTARFSHSAERMVEEALEKAALIGKVRTPAEQETAVAAQVQLERALKLCEKARVAAKAPVLKFARSLDASVHEFTEPLKEEALRISTNLGDYVTAQDAALKDRQAAANAELTQLERDRHEELSNAATHEERDEINSRYDELAKGIKMPELDKAPGQVVKVVTDFEVTDIWLLARTHPTCVKIEPRRSEIMELLKRGITPAGIRVKEATVSRVRVPPERKAIDV